jgi:hypothetical protein
MKIALIFLLLTGLTCLYGGQSRARVPVYQAGEKLRYQLYWGPVTGGEVNLTLSPTIFNGRRALHAVATGTTTGLADRLYRIHDIYESYMDPVTGLPMKAIRNISEGNYRYYNEVIYNRDSNTVVSQLSGVHEVPPGILDMVSVIYKLRDTMQTTILRAGDVIELEAYFSDKIYPIVVRYRGTETIRTRMGRFHALKFSPVSEPGRMFRTEDDITVWFSNDRNFVPLRVRLNLLLGSMRMDLIEHTGLRHELIDLR